MEATNILREHIQ